MRSPIPEGSPGLWLRIALPFLLFVAAGSLALILWLRADARRESRAVFATLARTNADFIRTTNLARSERMAEYLGRILNTRVYFRQAGGIVPARGLNGPDAAFLASLGGEVVSDAQWEGIAVPLGPDEDLVLARARVAETDFLFAPGTTLALGAFWLLSLGLAWALARGLVRPLRTLAARLERAERLALLGRMSTGLAHEIHNPVSAIRMHAQLVGSADDGELRDTADASIPLILAEAAQIENLVNQWMFLARPAPPSTSPTDLDAVVRDAAESLRPLADHARVRIARDVAPGLSADADRRRLSQAIGNTMLNAIQAMHGGGTLSVRSRRKGETVELTFRDTGKGFSAEALARCTELFYSEKEGGMGIGLNVSAEILKAHGGALQVANAPEGGAVVSLVLPASES